MATKVIMPQMGESVVEGTVSRWLKQEGEHVEEYEPLLEVETDKVTSEVTAVCRRHPAENLCERGTNSHGRHRAGDDRQAG